MVVSFWGGTAPFFGLIVHNSGCLGLWPDQSGSEGGVEEDARLSIEGSTLGGEPRVDAISET